MTKRNRISPRRLCEVAAEELHYQRENGRATEIAAALAWLRLSEQLPKIWAVLDASPAQYAKESLAVLRTVIRDDRLPRRSR
jgi:hypothetical protein